MKTVWHVICVPVALVSLSSAAFAGGKGTEPTSGPTCPQGYRLMTEVDKDNQCKNTCAIPQLKSEVKVGRMAVYNDSGDEEKYKKSVAACEKCRTEHTKIYCANSKGERVEPKSSDVRLEKR